ncbi:MAG: DNA polymerase II large subunit [Candidatus Diapherotrites archaeon]|nr:DNA polymerase II large subunit [Candidatus Diapherotrites archaeon]
MISRPVIVGEEKIRKYYEEFFTRVDEQFNAAVSAKESGRDVSVEVECRPTADLADRTENIIGPKGIAKRFREVFAENKEDRVKTIFQLFREILEQKWCSIPNEEKRLEQAVKSALVLVTEGVVVAPLDGVPQVKISKNPDGSRYVDIYFAGPIRAAGGTATVFPLILGDYARQLLGLDRYKPTEDEVERYAEEIQAYDDIISRQYKLAPDEIRKIVRGCPVCINGEQTEDTEVTAYRDLERIPTNRIRGGMCLVVSEGIGLKARKILTYAKLLGLNWNWLEEIIKVNKAGDSSGEDTGSTEPNYKFLTKIAAGRPIFAYPSTKGGFRLRYGRARNTGIMGRGIHPVTMHLLDDFIAVGTQLKIERPGKSTEIFPVDTIQPPIVRLTGGEIKKIASVQELAVCKNSVEKILFLGDMLVSVGDFRKTAHPLMPAGYCEEWWKLEVREALKGKKPEGINAEKILSGEKEVDGITATEISTQLGVPMHPEFIHFYKFLSKSELEELCIAAQAAKAVFEEENISGAWLENAPETKKALEKILLPHMVGENGIFIEKKYAYTFLKTFGFFSHRKPSEEKEALENLSEISGITILDKAGTFIGARMGRPEAAKPRKMVGNPHCLFPIGIAGGSTRSINKAALKQSIEVEMAYNLCTNCKKTLPQSFCQDCMQRTVLVYYCEKCRKFVQDEKCTSCLLETRAFQKTSIQVDYLLEQSAKNLRIKMPEIVKGVRGLINARKVAEPLEKGILRAAHDLHIFRDATIRFEMLNAPITHFKPREIGTSVEKLRQLGYTHDYRGKELENDEQLLEIFPQDLIVNDDALGFFYTVTRFVDDELEKFYQKKPFFQKQDKSEMIGELVLGLAPHTSAAILGRIIGTTKARVCFAHPFFHLTKRRNVDGDQDSVMLLMDALLNFSEYYLPSTRGGRMDAPLVFTIALNPLEIDDEAYEIETCEEYPLKLYQSSLKNAPPFTVEIDRVAKKLGKEGQYTGLNFTHQTKTFDAGPKVSTYITLQKMEEKIGKQARLQKKIEAVQFKDSLERVLVSHFLPDIIGNARSFSKQNFRCTHCNTKYRRIPLAGHCTHCKGGNLILTISEGSIIKYLNIAKNICIEYGLSNYLKQRLDLVEEEVKSIFTPEKTSQKSLFEFA